MHVVILHGWGHSHAQWQTIVPMLAVDHQVTVIDLPGFGDEPAPDPSWGIPEYAAWAEARIRPLGDCIVIGHSFGGRIAAYIAAKRPAWLKGLVLYGAPCLYRPFTSVKFRNFVGNLGGKLPIPESIRRRVRGDEENAAMGAGIRSIFRRVVAFDQTEMVQDINVPTLLLWGEHDVEAPMHIAHELKKIIPGSELTVMQGAGHSAHLEQPTLFYGIVKRFLARCA